MTAVRGIPVDIPTPDGTADAYLSYLDDGQRHPAVLLFMDAFGLRPQLQQMADRLAEAGYTVLVPNVLHRAGRAPLFDLPDFIDQKKRPEIFQRITPVMRTLTPDLFIRDAEVYLDWLAGRPESEGGPVGITGYCLGARLALYAAGSYPERVAAVAGFHGGRLATEAPDSPHTFVDRVTAEVYFGHADRDHSLPPEQIERLDKALEAAGVRYRTEVYPGAPHGYTQADTSSYHPEAAERHWTELLALFDRAL